MLNCSVEIVSNFLRRIYSQFYNEWKPHNSPLLRFQCETKNFYSIVFELNMYIYLD